MAQFQISESVTINRPAEAVFQYVTDMSKHAEWRPDLEAIRDYSGPPFTEGTTFSEVSKFMGREMVADFAVTAFEEGRQARLSMDAGTATGNQVWAVQPETDASSTFTLSFDGEVTGWLGRLGTGMIRRQAAKDMTNDLARLKAILETG